MVAFGRANRWRARSELVFPVRWCLPVELPQSPRVRVRFAKQFASFHVTPPSVLSFDFRDFRIARPSGSAHAHSACVRRHHLAFLGRAISALICISLSGVIQGSSPLCQRPSQSSASTPVIKRLIVSGKRPVGDDDALEPFDRCHRVPTGHDCAHRKTVLRRQIFAIHFVGQQHVAACFLQRNAARELQFTGRTLWDPQGCHNRLLPELLRARLA